MEEQKKAELERDKKHIYTNAMRFDGPHLPCLDNVR